MLERFVLRFVQSQIKNYLVNFDARDLKIRAGEIRLQNLEINPAALENLNLPVRIVKGHLGEVYAKIRWAKLTTAPVEVIIQNIYLVAVPQSEWDEEKYENRKKIAKETKLEADEFARKLEREGFEEGEKKVKLPKIMEKILLNMIVTIKNIHICYEDHYTTPLRPFILGIMLGSLTVSTTDSNFEPYVMKDVRKETVFKLVKLDRFSVYWNADDAFRSMVELAKTPGQEVSKRMLEILEQSKVRTPEDQGRYDLEPTQRYVVHPFAAELKFALKKEENTRGEPRIACNVTLPFLAIDFDRSQQTDLAALVSFLSSQRRFIRKRNRRPKLLPRRLPGTEEYAERRKKLLQEWWQYAIETTRDSVRNKLSKESWSHLLRHRRMRHEYLALWKQVLTEWDTGDRGSYALSPKQAAQRLEIEHALSVDQIVFFRNMAELHYEVELQKVKPLSDYKTLLAHELVSLKRRRKFYQSLFKKKNKLLEGTEAQGMEESNAFTALEDLHGASDEEAGDSALANDSGRTKATRRRSSRRRRNRIVDPARRLEVIAAAKTREELAQKIQMFIEKEHIDLTGDRLQQYLEDHVYPEFYVYLKRHGGEEAAMKDESILMSMTIHLHFAAFSLLDAPRKFSFPPQPLPDHAHISAGRGWQKIRRAVPVILAAYPHRDRRLRRARIVMSGVTTTVRQFGSTGQTGTVRCEIMDLEIRDLSPTTQFPTVFHFKDGTESKVGSPRITADIGFGGEVADVKFVCYRPQVVYCHFISQVLAFLQPPRPLLKFNIMTPPYAADRQRLVETTWKTDEQMRRILEANLGVTISITLLDATGIVPEEQHKSSNPIVLGATLDKAVVLVDLVGPKAKQQASSDDFWNKNRTSSARLGTDNTVPELYDQVRIQFYGVIPRLCRRAEWAQLMSDKKPKSQTYQVAEKCNLQIRLCKAIRYRAQSLSIMFPERAVVRVSCQQYRMLFGMIQSVTAGMKKARAGGLNQFLLLKRMYEYGEEFPSFQAVGIFFPRGAELALYNWDKEQIGIFTHDARVDISTVGRRQSITVAAHHANIDAFNPHLHHWEPLIEQLAAPKVLIDQNVEEGVRKLEIRVQVDEVPQVAVNAPMLESLMALLKDWQYATREWPNAATPCMPSTFYELRNDLNTPLLYRLPRDWLPPTKAGTEHAAADQRVLEPNKVALLPLSTQFTRFDRTMAMKPYAVDIAPTLAGSTNASSVVLWRALMLSDGTYVLPVSAEVDGPEVVCELTSVYPAVTTQEKSLRRCLSVRSLVSIRNATDVTLEFAAAESPDVPPDSALLFEAEAGELTSVPWHLALRGHLWVRPKALLNVSHWLPSPIPLVSFWAGTLPGSQALSCPAASPNNWQSRPFHFVLQPQYVKIYSRPTSRRLSRPHPIVITVAAPLQLHNLLPHPIRFSVSPPVSLSRPLPQARFSLPTLSPDYISDAFADGVIPVGGVANICSCLPSDDSVELRFSSANDNNPFPPLWSPPLKISPRLPPRVEVFPGNIAAPVHALVSEMEAAKSSPRLWRKLAIYAPWWIINDTGLPLRLVSRGCADRDLEPAELMCDPMAVCTPVVSFANATASSRPIVLDAALDKKLISIAGASTAASAQEEVLVTVSKAAEPVRRWTKVLLVSSPVCFVNLLPDLPIDVAKVSGSESRTVEAGSTLRWCCAWGTGAARQVKVRIAGGYWDWTGSVELSAGVYSVKVRPVQRLVHDEIELKATAKPRRTVSGMHRLIPRANFIPGYGDVYWACEDPEPSAESYDLRATLELRLRSMDLLFSKRASTIEVDPLLSRRPSSPAPHKLGANNRVSISVAQYLGGPSATASRQQSLSAPLVTVHVPRSRQRNAAHRTMIKYNRLPIFVVLRLHVQKKGANLVVFVKEETTADCSFRLENQLVWPQPSHHTAAAPWLLTYHQAASEVNDSLVSGLSAPFGWDSLAFPNYGKIQLSVTDPRTRQRSPFKTYDMLVEGEQVFEHHVFEHSDGAVPVSVSIFRDNAVKIIRVFPTPNQAGLGPFFSPRQRMLVSVDTPGALVSVCDDRPRELFLLSLTDFHFFHEKWGPKQVFRGRVGRLQIDNMLASFHQPFPVLLAPLPHLLDKNRPHVEFEIVKFASTPVVATQQFKTISFALQPVQVLVDEETVLQVVSYVRRLQASKKASTASSAAAFVLSLSTSSVLHSTPKEKKRMYVEAMQLPEMLFVLTMRKLDTIDCGEGPDASFPSPLFEAFGVTFGHADSVHISIPKLDVKRVAGAADVLSKMVQKHMVQKVGPQAAAVVGSMDVLGSPVGFVRNMCVGVRDLFELPARGITDPSSTFASGLARGSKSFVANTVCAPFDTTSKISASISRGLDVLSFGSHRYRVLRRIEQHERPGDIAEGFVLATKRLTLGIVRGISGLVLDPYRGAKEDGLSGFGVGVGRGLAGVVTKPVSGSLDFVTKITQGFHNTWNERALLKRTRVPRSFGPNKAMLPVSKDLSEALWLLENHPAVHPSIRHARPESILLRVNSSSGRVVVVTERRVLVMRKPKKEDLERCAEQPSRQVKEMLTCTNSAGWDDDPTTWEVALEDISGWEQKTPFDTPGQVYGIELTVRGSEQRRMLICMNDPDQHALLTALNSAARSITVWTTP